MESGVEGEAAVAEVKCQGSTLGEPLPEFYGLPTFVVQ